MRAGLCHHGAGSQRHQHSRAVRGAVRCEDGLDEPYGSDSDHGWAGDRLRVLLRCCGPRNPVQLQDRYWKLQYTVCWRDLRQGDGRRVLRRVLDNQHGQGGLHGGAHHAPRGGVQRPDLGVDHHHERQRLPRRRHHHRLDREWRGAEAEVMLVPERSARYVHRPDVYDVDRASSPRHRRLQVRLHRGQNQTDSHAR